MQEEDAMYVPIILGTAREGRESEKVAGFMLGQAEEHGLESGILDVRDYRMPATDNTGEPAAAKKLSGEISRADALIIVSPEYNHGYPGELKMMLDLAYGQYARKPVGICGVSSGPFGGARMVENLRPVLVAFGLAPILDTLYFPEVEGLFDDEGKIADESYRKRAGKFLSSLSWWTRSLRKGREP